MENRQIIEINGVKLEVDLSTAKVVENYRVGDIVKVLTKAYSNEWQSHAGTIVGFDAFRNRPTIIIAYIENSYNTDIKFIYYNADTENVEICPANSNDLAFSKETVIESMNREIANMKAKIEEIEQKRDFFINNFSQCFSFANSRES